MTDLHRSILTVGAIFERIDGERSGVDIAILVTP